MKKIEIVKLAAGGVVSLGVSTVVHSAVKRVIPIDLNTFRRLCVSGATLVMTGMASDKAVEYTNEQIDKGAALVTELVKDGELEPET